MPSNHFFLIIFLEWPLPIVIARCNLIKLNFKSRQSIQTNRSECCSFPKTKLIKSWENGKREKHHDDDCFRFSNRVSGPPIHPIHTLAFMYDNTVLYLLLSLLIRLFAHSFIRLFLVISLVHCAPTISATLFSTTTPVFLPLIWKFSSAE